VNYISGRPGDPPRKVEIERKKRLFASVNLTQAFLAKGRAFDFSQEPELTYLPLEIFDDAKYEGRTEEEWVELGSEAASVEDGIATVVPGWSLRLGEGGRGSWVECQMLNHDPDQNVYEIRWNDTLKRVWVHRVTLMFLAEDPENFVERYCGAYNARHMAEKKLQYSLYVDCMPTDEMKPLNSEQVHRIRSSAFNTDALRSSNLDETGLIEEANTDYSRAMNQIVFDISLNRPEQQELAQSLVGVVVPEEEVIPESAVIEIPNHKFGEQCGQFAFNSFLTKREVITAIQKVRNQCNMLLEQKLFVATHNKTVRIDEFETQQGVALSHCVGMLKDTWCPNLKSDIVQSLKGVGKGWFNLEEDNCQVYEYSKLKRFLTMVNVMMEDTLRFMTEASVENYEKLMLRQAAGKLIDVKSTHLVELALAPGYEGDENLLTEQPMFTLELTIKDGMTEPEYNIEPEKFVTVCMKVLKTGLNSVCDIEQLEHQIMDKMFWAERKCLKCVAMDESKIKASIERVQAALDAAVAPVHQYRQLYAHYNDFVALKVKDEIKALETSEETTLEDIVKLIQHHVREKGKVDHNIPADTLNLGLFALTCTQVRNKIYEKHESMILELHQLIIRLAAIRADAISEEYKDIYNYIHIKPKDIEALAEMRQYLETIPSMVEGLEIRIEQAKTFYNALDDSCFQLETDDFNRRMEVNRWPAKLAKAMKNVRRSHEVEENNFLDNLKGFQGRFKDEITEISTDIDAFMGVYDFTRVKEMSAQAFTFNRKLKEIEENVKKINSRELLFGTPITDYPGVPVVTKKFAPFSDLWVTSSNWIEWHDNWINGPLHDIDFENMRNDFDAAKKTMTKAKRIFSQDNPDMTEIATKVFDEIEEFSAITNNLGLVEALRNPGMKERHWTEMSNTLGMEISVGEDFTLRQAVDMGLGDPARIGIVTKIADVAQKQFIIESNLNGMEEQWKSVDFTVLEYKTTGTYVVKGSDEIAEILDDHIVQIQAMSFSPFKGPFEERIGEWESQLVMLQEVLGEWLTLQRQWMYLEPIFSSDDINRQLPAEGKKFASCNKFWRKTMNTAKARPQAIGFAQERLLADFSEYNETLDRVQKNLADYLETKRSGFARFYFLADDDLIQILSQTKEPTAVQKHLGKCFEAVSLLEFQGERSKLQITKMYSPEKECVDFKTPVRPVGNVENWLGEVEKMMKESVRHVLEVSIDEYKSIPREDWVIKYPGQVVLNASQVFWTSEVEESLDTGGNAGLAEYLKVLYTQLDGLVKIVRGKMSKLTSKTMGALITIDVHARDVIENMVRDKIANASEFEWVSQLRYYWQDYHNESEGTKRTDLVVKQVQCVFPYGYEYLGNTGRLVITALTDRCYMTLMGALFLHLGGAPAGPAGMGKTETTKDLAKALAKQCVVFNCSDGLDYKAMEKFFKGLAMSGAWACFDEFNRIDVEVLSVIAQQILDIQQAVVKKMKRFNFQGSDISLNPTCSVFITMNPGYAGRAELPDNLQALFRPVAMMVPNYALIAQIRLYSFGFQNARPLSEKQVATFTLASEQLSSQDHYDFGMRAVNAVITASGNLKRAYPEEDEEVLLMRALRDVNKPKFLANDVTLFAGIISDLFPGVEEPKSEYPELEANMEHCTLNHIQHNERRELCWVSMFKMKMVQLYETTVVRHGLMVVGPTGGGKSCIVRVLADAQTKSAKDGVEGFETTRIYSINPKSITMNQLYGAFDLSTGEWTDGIGATLFRHCSAPDPECGVAEEDKKWFYFDGPVDALWIENMNTVLDDNKKLCLVSGEMIKMSDGMTMMFEPEDLAVASPATVSRCGMVYVEPDYLCPSEDEPVSQGAYVQSWLKKLPETLTVHKDKFCLLFDSLVWKASYLVRKHLKETVVTVATNVFPSMLRLLDTFVEDYRPKEGRIMDEEFIAHAVNLIDAWVAFCCVWSLGATCTGEGRERFDQEIRDWMRDEPAFKLLFPKEEGKSVYDYVLDPDLEDTHWTPWLETVPRFELDNDLPYAQKIIPTKDSVCYRYLIKRLIENRKHVLTVGETGTAKSVTVQRLLSSGLEANFDAVFTGFSARTGANMIQDIIDDKFDKRRQGKKDGLEFLMHGPPIGKVTAIFIDDMNMPKREVYGAQPPIELLRQWMDHQGWYDRKLHKFKYTVDVVFAAAMGPPGGGKQPVTNRLLRHYNFISFSEMNDDSLAFMFGTILERFLQVKGFVEETQELCRPLVSASIFVYKECKKQLLPTPAKSHYTFNLRDLSKVFQGLLNASPGKMPDVDSFVRLWIHESCRVFQDRLVSVEDKNIFNDILDTQIEQTFYKTYDTLIHAERLVFGDYTEGVNADPKVYEEIYDMQGLRKMVDDYLEDYDSESKQPMKLVLFLDAIEHVSRINRILRLPLGNALLCGVGGSGRKSLTRLACYMADYKLYMIELGKGYGLNEWRENIKDVLRGVGLDNTPTVFLFDDTQIVHPAFLEDLNNILNSGEVPNLWKEEEIGDIFSAMTPLLVSKGINASKLNLMNEFITRCKDNLHLVVCMSPIGADFVIRLRQFPSLVNCCTIDWFSEWPYEALKSVAGDKCGHISFDDEDIREGVYEMFVSIHQSVETKTALYLSELRRYNYVTPTSYLELLGTFGVLLDEKKTELLKAIRRLEGGLKKIDDAEQLVDVLKVELAEKMPILVTTQAEVEEMMLVIAKDTKEAEVVEATASAAEADANEKKATAEGIAAEAQGKLDLALPALYAALANVDKLQKKDIDEMKSLSNPPNRVKQVMAAVCIYAKEKPTKVQDPNDPKRKINDYWKQSQGLLRDAKGFIELLKTYDKDNIEETVVALITPFVEDEDLNNDKVKATSLVAWPIMLWVRAMYDYHFVSKEVEPLRQAAAQAAETLAVAMASLAEAQAMLKEVQDKLGVLQANLKAAEDKKAALQADVDLTNLKLERADKLLSGLGGERARWKETVITLKVLEENIVGNVCAASGAIAYLGVFTAGYRGDLTSEWQNKLQELSLPVNLVSATLRGTLEDPVKVRQWNIEGLPSDSLSVENGIMIDKARRWPLCIDPQGQANKWIKFKEKANLGEDGVVKASDSSQRLQRALENAVRFGRTMILENIGESLEPSLEPVLLKQTFKQGGTEMMKLGDSVIAYDKNFKFYMTTNLRNPHYTPEVAVKVSLLNFMITPDGLEEQLLGVLVSKERPDCEEKKNELVVNNAKMKAELTNLEDHILALLEESGADILDEDTLIDALAESKQMKDEITLQMEAAAVTEKEIDAAREEYRPCAYRSQLLFFCVADLGSVDSMYQYSLTWFKNLFVGSIVQSERSDDVQKRMEIIDDFFTYALYDNVCRGLLEVHKLIFSFTLCVKLLQGYDKLDADEWRFLLAGPSGTECALPNPAPGWITEKMWIEVSKLSHLPAFTGLDKAVVEDPEAFKAFFDDANPDLRDPPAPWDEKWGTFQRTVFMRCLRPDKVVPIVSRFITDEMEEKYIHPPTFDLHKSFQEANNVSPIIFILSPGADPVKDLFAFAEMQGMRSKTDYISLGQGQDKKADIMIENGTKLGKWVLLQNCHLYKSWMPQLEKKVENLMPDMVHKDFRLWLTSMPSPFFPVSILEIGVKLVNEPPAGLKANLRRVYASVDEDYLTKSSKPEWWKKCVWSLSVFHATMLERRKFGPLGFNIRYSFTEGDADVGKQQTGVLLEDYDEVPWKVVRVLVTDINYGGRVTDDRDRRFMTSMIKGFACDEMLEDGYGFSPSGDYTSIPSGKLSEILEEIDKLPDHAAPEVFGFHDNAAITSATNDTLHMFTTVLALQPRTSSGAGLSREDTIDQLAVDTAQRVPGPYDMEPIMKAFPVRYDESMNTVLQQEIIRYNKLLSVMRSSLANVRKALVGQMVMTEELDALGSSMYNQQIPAMWAKQAYPSMKPLASWTNDLLARLDFLNDWIENGIPIHYWISGFFFPQAFLTGTLQNFARKLQLPIDTISFETCVMRVESEKEITERPVDGCYIHGLFLEGCRWDSRLHCLEESRPKELYTTMPPIHLNPIQNREKPAGIYFCPVYKILTRAGTLSTTGHSTNFVIMMEIPSQREEDHWIKRGVALFTQLLY